MVNSEVRAVIILAELDVSNVNVVGNNLNNFLNTSQVGKEIFSGSVLNRNGKRILFCKEERRSGVVNPFNIINRRI